MGSNQWSSISGTHTHTSYMLLIKLMQLTYLNNLHTNYTRQAIVECNNVYIQVLSLRSK